MTGHLNVDRLKASEYYEAGDWEAAQAISEVAGDATPEETLAGMLQMRREARSQ